MAPRKRSRASARPARVALLLAANALALLALWWLAAGPAAPGEVAAGAPPSEEWPTALAHPFPAPLAAAPALADEIRASDAPLARAATLRSVRAAVERARAKAADLTKGRVAPSAVRVAVHVRELDRPKSELALDADRAHMPASNMKLVTTAAALVLLGPGWHFTTRAEANGALADGELTGDLVLRAGGDPLFDGGARGSVDALLAPFVERLWDAGLRRVRGDLVLDEGDFADPAVPAGWPDEGQHWAEYCALAGGFSANRGCVTATVSGTRPGRPARVTVEPRHHGLPQTVDVESTAGGKLIVRLDAHGAAGVVVRGAVPASTSQWIGSCAHRDPVLLFGSALAGALRERGIELEGELRRERGASGGTTLAELFSPLAAVLGPINTDSDNGCADQLFLALGHARGGAGTRAAAARVTAEALERLGVPSSGFQQTDGSGLSRHNRVSARQMSALIGAVLELPGTAPALFRASLAVGGRTGTLADRLRGPSTAGRVHAKTGFIGGVSALSGVVESVAGPRYAFSVLVEYPVTDGLNTQCWKPLQDEICTLLAELAP
ncbi:MAG TPA: D-alanyl-D-alanine carboxypeptidase/D-alanyl-D-alanine-endopeptidase [Planctomycetota bacterium]|nr:D-alanyl-D-alanine carboxypeptidase/D-alanyl-D-alanine-endopeptidase [Planctomycetota bacterium]